MKTTASRASAVSQTRGFGDLLYDKAGARPSLDLDFAGTESLRDKITGDHLVDHTRASGGTYIGSDGLIKESRTNVHFDHRYVNSRSGIDYPVIGPLGNETSSGYLDISAKQNALIRNGTTAGNDGSNINYSFYAKTDQGTINATIDVNDRDVKGITITDQWQRFSCSTVGQTAASSSAYRFGDIILGSTVTGGATKVQFWGILIEKSDDINPREVITNTVSGGGDPRFTHERVETGNLLTDSTLKNPNHIKPHIRILQNQALAPDGTFSAAEMRCISSATNYMFANPTTTHIGIKDNTAYTVSIFAKKANTLDTFSIFLSEGGNKGATFNLTNKTASVYGGGQNTARITETDNGWFRCEVTNSGNPTTVTSQIRLGLLSTTFVQQAVTAGQSFYFWGFQFEEGEAASTVAPSIDTFTSRAGSATYVDSAGLIKTAALNYIKNSDSPSHHSHTTTGIHTTISYPSTAPTTDGPFGTNQLVKKAVVKDDKPDFTQYGSVSLGTLTSNQFIRIGADAGGGGIGGGLANQTFTWSFYYRSLSGDRRFSAATGAGSNRSYAQLTATSEWQRAELSGARSDTLNILDIFYLFNGGADLEFASFQVEKGSRASDYVVNPFTSSNMPAGTNTSAEARYSHDPETLTPTGLYLEPAATNTARVNNNFNQWTVQAGTITADVTTAPDGTQTADKYVPNTNNTYSHYVYQTNALSGTLSLSVFVKSAGLNYVTLSSYVTGGSTTTRSVSFNLSNGTIHTSQNATGKITKFPNDWYRVAITTTNSESQNFITIQPHNGNSPDLNNYFHVTYSGNGTDGMFLWGAQCEVGSSASSFIYNSTTSTVTRSADVYTSTANLTETFEPRGLLIEESRTNVIHYNTAFDTARISGTESGWIIGRGSIIANSDTAPDGTQTADKYVANTESHGLKGVYIQKTFTDGDGTILSAYVKAAGLNYVNLISQVTGASDARGVQFNLTNGTVENSLNATGEIIYVGNGWYRIIVKPTTPNSQTYFLILPNTGATPGNTNYFRSIYHGNNSDGMLIWGAQQEAGSFATSLIFNDGQSHVTRSPDVVSISGDNFGTYRTNKVLKTLQDPFHTTATLFPRQSYAALAPDGTFSALRVKLNGNQTSQYLQTPNLTSPSTADGAAVTFSFYAKADAGETITAKTKMGRNGTENSFPTLTITDQWQRFQAVDTGNSIGNTKEFFGLLFTNASDAGKYLTIWGLQVEENGTGATNFIPSTDTFTSRLGNATYVDSDGLIKTSKVNLEKFSNSPSVQPGYSNGLIEDISTEVDPPIPEIPNVLKVTTSANNSYRVKTRHTVPNGIYTVSFYVKKGNVDVIQHNLVFTNGTLRFDFSTETLTMVREISSNQGQYISFSFDKLQNGWYRLKATFNITNTKINSGYNAADNIGNGYTYYAGWQWEEGSEASDYIFTPSGVQSGAPRYSHDPETLAPTGLYLEPAATTHGKGASFSNPPVPNAPNIPLPITIDGGGDYRTLTNDVTAPDGSNTTISYIKPNNAGYARFGVQSYLQPNTTYTFSIFVKYPDDAISLNKTSLTNHSSYGFIEIYGGASAGGRLYPNNDNYRYEVYPNGWYRIIATFTTTSTTSNSSIASIAWSYQLSASGHLHEYWMQNKSYFWGPNLTEGNYASSYIPIPANTGGTDKFGTVTRAADTYTSTATTMFDRDGGNKEAFWSPTANTMFGQMIYNEKTLYPRLYELSSPNGETNTVFMVQTNGQINGRMTTQAGAQYNLLIGSAIHNTSVKLVNTYQLNDATVAIDGSVHAVDNTVALHVLPTDSKRPILANIGAISNGTRHTNAPIQRITSWKTRLPNQSLINITT